MNKTVMAVIAAIIILGGVGLAVTSNSSDESSSNNDSSTTAQGDAMEKTADAMEKEGEEAMMKHDDSMEHDDAMMKEDGDEAMMKKTDTFVSLADYEADKDAYADKNKVHFFHASWCPVCKGIEDDIVSDPSQIPSDTVFIKTDFDDATDLRQKYGVTTQYTFVQIDNNGNETAQWTATSLDKAIAGIQS